MSVILLVVRLANLLVLVYDRERNHRIYVAEERIYGYLRTIHYPAPSNFS